MGRVRPKGVHRPDQAQPSGEWLNLTSIRPKDAKERVNSVPLLHYRRSKFIARAT